MNEYIINIITYTTTTILLLYNFSLAAIHIYIYIYIRTIFLMYPLATDFFPHMTHIAIFEHHYDINYEREDYDFGRNGLFNILKYLFKKESNRFH